jgi:hypothetical protein
MKAWIENNRVRDIAHADPQLIFHPDVAKLYDTDIPDDIVVGASLVDGVWTNPLPPIPLSQEELAAMNEAQRESQRESESQRIRQERNAKLAACDWTQLVDSPLSNRDAWSARRQALRDVPQQIGFPFNVIWPT